MGQSNLYKHQTNIDYIGDFPGAEREKDRLKVFIAAGSMGITDRVDRALGQVSITGTPIEDALAANGVDHLLVQQKSPVAIEDVTGTQISPATEGTLSTLAAAAGTNATDILRVGSPNPLDVSAAEVSVDPSTNISSETFDNGTGLAADGTITRTMSASSAEALVGRVVRETTGYDLHVDWKDDAGNVLFTDDVALGVTAGTATDINISPAPSPYCDVRVVDTGSASGAVTATLHLR